MHINDTHFNRGCFNPLYLLLVGVEPIGRRRDKLATAFSLSSLSLAASFSTACTRTTSSMPATTAE